ncbi:hypothetical protein ACLKA6_001555 [Drosophila palustris]
MRQMLRVSLTLQKNVCNTGSCKAFNVLPLQQRLNTIKNSHACFNCLRKAHRVKDCQSKSRCKVCQSTHHTLLHKYVQASVSSGPQSGSTINQPSVSTSLVAHSSSTAVLPSALVQIQDNQEFPVGAATLRSDLYVDDVLTGADNISLLQQKKDETVKILAKAGLQLTKFSSNSKDITPTSENEFLTYFAALTESSLTTR